MEGRYPYLFVDAKVEKVRDGGRVVRKCVVIAHGVHETGRREIIGLDVGEAETEAFWREFLRGLVARGLVGVQLAISDAHPGLKAALAQVLGAPWQRCTVHFLRDCLGHARRDQHGLLGAHDPPDLQRRLARGRRASGSPTRSRSSSGRLPKVAAMLEEAEDDILAFYAFPADHWRKLRSTNPLERFNREIGRRTDVVGIFPDDPSLIRLASMLAIEQNDEWLVGRRYLSAGVDGAAPRGAAPSTQTTRRSSSSNRPEQPTTSPTTMSASLLHHVPGLDSSRASRARDRRRPLPPRGAAGVGGAALSPGSSRGGSAGRDSPSWRREQSSRSASAPRSPL